MLASKMFKNQPAIYTVEDIEYSLKYQENNNRKDLYNIHMNGQVKLLLNEIRFLNEDVEMKNFINDKIRILYIGSGKGFHIPYLIQLYNKYDIIWEFYDPNGHCDNLNKIEKKNPQKIKIHNTYFTDKNIEYYKYNERKLIFISDIRSIDENKKEPSTINLLNDYQLQNNILIQLKPMFSLVKFRMPFPDDWKTEYNFLKPIGKEYIQAFTKPSSTEFRIFINSIITFEKISSPSVLKKYEEKLYWYNNVYRITNKNDLVIASYIINEYNKTEKNNYLPMINYDSTNIINHINQITTTF